MMDRNTAAQAPASDGAAAKPEFPKEKHHSQYPQHREKMASIYMRALDRRLTAAEKKAARREAIAQFKQEAIGDTSGLDLDYLARDVLNRLHTDGKLGNRPRAGAAPKLSAAKRGRALALFLRGNGKVGDEFEGFRSQAHALEECQELRDIWKESGVSRRTLWRALRKEYRTLYKCELRTISIYYRPKLEPHIKKERLETAEVWCEKSLEELRRTVWIDEKQEYLKKGGTLRCYAPFGMASQQREAEAVLGKCPRLKYLAAVAGFCGPVSFEACMGTTHMARGYLVRTVPPWAHLDPSATCRASLPCRVEHLHLDPTVRLCYAQHAVALLCCPRADLCILACLYDVILVLSAKVVHAVVVDQEPALRRCWMRTRHALIEYNVHAGFEVGCVCEWAHLMDTVPVPPTHAVFADVTQQRLLAFRRRSDRLNLEI